MSTLCTDRIAVIITGKVKKINQSLYRPGKDRRVQGG
jgi:hypothetical protein